MSYVMSGFAACRRTSSYVGLLRVSFLPRRGASALKSLQPVRRKHDDSTSNFGKSDDPATATSADKSYGASQLQVNTFQRGTNIGPAKGPMKVGDPVPTNVPEVPAERRPEAPFEISPEMPSQPARVIPSQPEIKPPGPHTITCSGKSSSSDSGFQQDTFDSERVNKTKECPIEEFQSSVESETKPTYEMSPTQEFIKDPKYETTSMESTTIKGDGQTYLDGSGEMPAGRYRSFFSSETMTPEKLRHEAYQNSPEDEMKTYGMESNNTPKDGESNNKADRIEPPAMDSFAKNVPDSTDLSSFSVAIPPAPFAAPTPTTTKDSSPTPDPGKASADDSAKLSNAKSTVDELKVQPPWLSQMHARSKTSSMSIDIPAKEESFQVNIPEPLRTSSLSYITKDLSPDSTSSNKWENNKARKEKHKKDRAALKAKKSPVEPSTGERADEIANREEVKKAKVSNRSSRDELPLLARATVKKNKSPVDPKKVAQWWRPGETAHLQESQQEAYPCNHSSRDEMNPLLKPESQYRVNDKTKEVKEAKTTLKSEDGKTNEFKSFAVAKIDSVKTKASEIFQQLYERASIKEKNDAAVADDHVQKWVENFKTQIEKRQLKESNKNKETKKDETIQAVPTNIETKKDNTIQAVPTNIETNKDNTIQATPTIIETKKDETSASKNNPKTPPTVSEDVKSQEGNANDSQSKGSLKVTASISKPKVSSKNINDKPDLALPIKIVPKEETVTAVGKIVKPIPPSDFKSSKDAPSTSSSQSPRISEFILNQPSPMSTTDEKSGDSGQMKTEKYVGKSTQEIVAMFKDDNDSGLNKDQENRVKEVFEKLAKLDQGQDHWWTLSDLSQATHTTPEEVRAILAPTSKNKESIDSKSVPETAEAKKDSKEAKTVEKSFKKAGKKEAKEPKIFSPWRTHKKVYSHMNVKGQNPVANASGTAKNIEGVSPIKTDKESSSLEQDDKKSKMLTTISSFMSNNESQESGSNKAQKIDSVSTFNDNIKKTVPIQFVSQTFEDHKKEISNVKTFGVLDEHDEEWESNEKSKSDEDLYDEYIAEITQPTMMGESKDKLPKEDLTYLSHMDSRIEDDEDDAETQNLIKHILGEVEGEDDEDEDDNKYITGNLADHISSFKKASKEFRASGDELDSIKSEMTPSDLYDPLSDEVSSSSFEGSSDVDDKAEEVPQASSKEKADSTLEATTEAAPKKKPALDKGEQLALKLLDKEHPGPLTDLMAKPAEKTFIQILFDKIMGGKKSDGGSGSGGGSGSPTGSAGGGGSAGDTKRKMSTFGGRCLYSTNSVILPPTSGLLQEEVEKNEAADSKRDPETKSDTTETPVNFCLQEPVLSPPTFQLFAKKSKKRTNLTKIKGGSKACTHPRKSPRDLLREKSQSRDIKILGGSEPCAEKLRGIKTTDDDCTFSGLGRQLWVLEKHQRQNNQ